MCKGKGGIMSICPSINPHNWSRKCLSIYISVSLQFYGEQFPLELSPMSTNAVKPELLHAFTTQGEVSPRHPRSLSLNPHIIPHNSLTLLNPFLPNSPPSHLLPQPQSLPNNSLTSPHN
jgi:hypothetical protein